MKTKRNETKRNETKRNETKRTESQFGITFFDRWGDEKKSREETDMAPFELHCLSIYQ